MVYFRPSLAAYPFGTKMFKGCRGKGLNLCTLHACTAGTSTKTVPLQALGELINSSTLGSSRV